jgi:hypothetical protein
LNSAVFPVHEDYGGVDAEDVAMRVNPIDTTGLVFIYLVSGYDPEACRYSRAYDSTSFRTIRSELPTYARDIVDTSYELSMVNYFKIQSSGKHIIRGTVLPPGDTAYGCWDKPTSYNMPSDIDTVFFQADCDINFGDYDLTSRDSIGVPDGKVDCIGLIVMNQYGTGGSVPAWLPGNYVYKTNDINSSVTSWLTCRRLI